MRHILFCFIIISCLRSQAQDYYFRHLDIEEGLSQTSVLSIHQDDLDRIWIGTREGLNVYDGSEIRSFLPSLGDSTGLLGYKIKGIVQIERTLYIMTELAINTLDLDLMEFKSYPLQYLNQGSIAVCQNKVYIGTVKGGIFVFDPDTKSYNRLEGIVSSKEGIGTLYCHEDKLLIGTTTTKLISFDPATNRSFTIFHKDMGSAISAVFVDNKAQKWIGMDTQGVIVLDSGNAIVAHLTVESPGMKLSSNVIRDIIEDSNQKIWISTFNGLNVIDQKLATINHIESSEIDPKALSWHSAHDLMLDREGNIWVGTYFGGANYTNTHQQIYRYYDNKNDANYRPSSRVIGRMLEDEKHNIWIATEGKGVNYHDTKKGTFRYFENTASNVRSMLVVDKNTLYLGTHYEGLNILNTKTGEVKKFVKSSPEDLAPNIVNSVIKFKDKFLLGCRSGVLLFDPVTETFSHELGQGNSALRIDEPVFCLYEDSYDRIWVGTETGGVMVYDTHRNTIRRYTANSGDSTSIGGNSVYTIMEDHQFRIWIATLGHGLSLYNPKEDNFQTFTKASHDIPSNFVIGLAESRYGNLWVSTSKGLSRFDVENDLFYNYTRDNGFPYGELNQGGLLLASTGRLYVGSIKGLVSIDEKDLLTSADTVNLLFSSLEVNNTKVFPNDGNNVLLKDISVAKSMKLHPGHTSFSLEYGVSSYDREFNNFKVKLVGFDEEWIDVGKSNRVSYTNLSPGDYKLRVQVIDAVFNKPIAEKHLDIEVEAAFYQTELAKFIYILLFLGIIFLIVYSYASRLKLKVEVQDKENIRKLNQHKLQFFTNISHEFMTPLTLILGSLETVLNKEHISLRMSRKLRVIYNNALRLKHLSGELLDFRKLEQGHLKLNVYEQDFIAYINDIVSSFSDKAYQNSIKIEFKSESPNISLWFDMFQLDKVFYNLLSNAFKAVEEKTGRIEVRVIENENDVLVYVKDNGPGIPEESIKLIFDRFYQSNNLSPRKGGSGLGLALSEGVISAHGGTMEVAESTSNGTTFKVMLRKGAGHFSSEQLSAAASGAPQDVNTEDKREILRKADAVFSVKEIATQTHDDGEEEAEIKQSRFKILIVEDNQDVRNLITDVLVDDYEVKTANDGQEGLDEAMKWNPDLIISDVMMPKMSGIQLCTKLKRNIHTSHIPVILLTAKTAMEHRLEGLNIGADDYITKPFEVIYLKTRIVNLFENRKRLIERFRSAPTPNADEITHNSVDQEFMAATLALLDERIADEGFNVNTFAQEMGKSRTLFFKKIKSITGQTPNDFIQSYRLKKAAGILVEYPGKNVSEVAYEVGFGSPKYFSKCFKEHYGVIPTAYRKTKEEYSKADD